MKAGSSSCIDDEKRNDKVTAKMGPLVRDDLQRASQSYVCYFWYFFGVCEASAFHQGKYLSENGFFLQNVVNLCGQLKV